MAHRRVSDVIKGVRADLDEAATRAVQAVRWSPATKQGQSVETTVAVPIRFKLERKAK